MSNTDSRLSSRRGFILMGVLAAAGTVPGCGDGSAPTEVHEPTEKGNRKRLDMLGEKSQALAKKKQKR